MKKKIKLRDLTEQQYKKWFEENKNKIHIESKILGMICQPILEDFTDYTHIYSDKFLDQEIEVPELLTAKEKEYLEVVVRPFKDIVEYIAKSNMDNNLEYLCIKIKDDYHLCFPNFLKNKYYKGLEIEKKYTLEDLELFKKGYKITLTEFWNSEDKLAIHCDTKEKANKFIQESNKTYKWGNYGNFYEKYKKETCYSNSSQYCDLKYYKENNYTIYEIDEVDLEN